MMRHHSSLLSSAVNTTLILIAASGLLSCSQTGESGQSGIKQITVDPMTNKGIGPVDSIELGVFNPELAETGAEIYKEKCTVCHKPTENYLGPAPKGVLERRTPEWVMNMILNPTEMIKSDPIAVELFRTYNNYPMTNQNLSREEARAVLEYFRSL